MVRLLSFLIGLLWLCGTPAVSQAEQSFVPEMPSPPSSSSYIHPIAITPTNTRIIAVVPASAFPNCKNVVGGILYLTRVQRTPESVDNSNVVTTGPVCSLSSPSSSALDSTAEPLLVVPATKEGTLSDQPCMVIATPQKYCEIPDGSLLSAYPLA